MTGEEYLRLLGHGLAIARTKRGLTQEAAAALLNIHVVTLSQYERGLHQPRPATLLKMSEVYQLPLNELFALAFGVFADGDGYNNRNILSMAQASQIADLSPSTLKNQALKGRLRAEKVGGKTWITTRAWLQEYLDSRQHVKNNRQPSSANGVVAGGGN